MKTVFFSALAFILSAIFTPLARRFCLKFNFLDLPDCRKIHKNAVPRLGGIAVVFSFSLTLLLVLVSDKALRVGFSSQLAGLFASVLLLLILGIWDDTRGVKPVIKIIVQVIIALILFNSGLRVQVLTNPLGSTQIQLSFLASLFLTIAWIVGIINAINLIDGSDGIASGVVFISGICLLFAGLYLKSHVTVILLGILCAGSLGFLLYNFPPAKIFLGDTGSMFYGLILAVIGLVGLQYKVATAAALLVPVSALAIPIYDTFFAVLRRLSKKGSIFIADKKHLHHRILELGLAPRQVAFAFYLATLYFGIISFLFVLIPEGYALLLFVLLAIGMFAGIRTIGFMERAIRKASNKGIPE